MTDINIMLFYICVTCLCITAPFFVICTFFVIFYFVKGFRFQRGKHKKLKKRSILIRLFVDAPRQFVQDIYNRNPDFFRYSGCVIFVGIQGAGKTIAMVKYAMDMLKEYPLAKCISNLGYAYQDDELDDWRKLIDYKNDIYGVVAMLDELQNWFSSNQSRNFPPEMLQVITQNRKNRRILLGTSQNFYLLAKAIRSQSTEVRECFTVLGCITFVRRKVPLLDASGDVKEWKHRGFYFFVHNEKIRNAYDTYKVIDSLSKSGFKEKTDIEVKVSA